MPRQRIDLSNKAEWSVKKVHVKEGNRVAKGTTLATYENPAAEQEVLDRQDDIAQQRLALAGLQDAYIEAVQNNDEMQVRRSKRELERAQLAIGVQERKLRTMQSETGARERILAPFDGVVTQVRATAQLPSGSGGPDISVVNSQQGYQFEIVVPDVWGRKLRPEEKLNVQIEHEGAAVAVEGLVREVVAADADIAAEAHLGLRRTRHQHKPSRDGEPSQLSDHRLRGAVRAAADGRAKRHAHAARIGSLARRFKIWPFAAWTEDGRAARDKKKGTAKRHPLHIVTGGGEPPRLHQRE